MSLDRKLPLLITALLLLVLGAGLVVSYRQVTSASRAVAVEELRRITRELAANSETSLRLRAQVVHDSAARGIVRRALEGGRVSPRALDSALQRLRLPADTGLPIELWDADGRSVSIDSSRTLLPAGTRPEAGDAIPPRGDSAHYGPLFASGGHVYFWFVTPVVADGRRVGWIAQERRIATGSQGERTLRGLFGEDVAVYFRNDSGSVWTTIRGTPAPAPMDERAENGAITRFRTDSAGDARPMLAAEARVGGTPFVLTLERPLDAATAEARATMTRLALFSLLLLLAGAAAAWAISRRLTRPLVELTGAATDSVARADHSRAVASGHAGRGDEVGRLASSFVRMLDEVGASRAELERQVREARLLSEELRLLSEASRVLASSLDSRTTLDTVAGLVVPALADWCVVAIAEPDGAVRPRMVRHRDRSRQPALERMFSRYAIDPASPAGVGRVLRGGQSELVADVSDAALAGIARNPEQLELLRTVGLRSWLSVPLAAHGRVLGVLSLVSADPARRYGPRDRDLVEELARRAAIALENARLFEEAEAARREAVGANRAKSAFLATMSHELRTPLNAISGYVELIEMGIYGMVTAEQKDALARIRRSQRALLSLIDDVLSFARIEAQRVEYHCTAVAVDDALGGLEALVAPQIAARELSYTYEPAGPDARVWADRDKLEQIVLNLLSNAIKFTERGGRITMRSERAGDGKEAGDDVLVHVTDTGRGIGADHLETIFEPFTQAEVGLTRTAEGSGLGLAISREFARAMGGDLTVESTPGVGSTFTLRLPSREAAAAADSRQLTASGAPQES